MTAIIDGDLVGTPAPSPAARPRAARLPGGQSAAADTPPAHAGGTGGVLEKSHWGFILKYFEKMPAWVQVLTYLVILAISVYNSLLPTAISGSLLQRDLQGRLSENRKIAYVAVWFEGPPLKMQLDGGGWRVPVINRAPWKAQHVSFYDADDRIVFELEPSIPSLMFAASEYALVYDEKSGKVQRAGRSGALAFLSGLIPAAQAQGVDKSADPPPSDCGELCRKIARAADVDPAELRAHVPLESLAPQQDLASFRRSLASRIAIDPHKVDWAKVRTVDDLQRFATAYSAAGNISTEIKAALATAASTPDLRLSFSDGSKQLRNARANMNVPVDETALGLLNATFSGDGTEGMLFGTRGIYYRTSWLRRDGPEVAFVSYDDLAERSLRRNGAYEVSLDRGQYFVTAKSQVSSQQLVDVLERIQAATRLHHSAALAGWR